MKRSQRRLPIPQHEFGFTPDTFNLLAEPSADGGRITREAEVRLPNAEARQRRHAADAALSPCLPTSNS